MGRHSTPERIYQARRAAVISRLVQDRRLSEQRAEALVAGWEAEAEHRAAERYPPGFWSDAHVWIVEQLDAR